MMRMMALALAAATGACAYQAPTEVSAALNVYSSYDDPLPLNVALYVEAEDLAADVRPDGYDCSAHRFPVDARAAFVGSVVQTLGNLTRSVVVVDQPISTGQFARTGVDAMVVVTSEDLDSDLIFIQRPFNADVEAEIEIEARITVDGPQGRLLGTSVQGDGEARQAAGSFCSGGAPAVGEATNEAIEDTMQRLGERFTNSARLREYADQVSRSGSRL